MKHIKITCPTCNTELVVDRIEEKIVETRKPILEKTTGDRFKDALIKSKQLIAETEKKFKESKEAQKKRSESLKDLFNKSLDKVKKAGDKSKPENPFDYEWLNWQLSFVRIKSERIKHSKGIRLKY